MLYYTYIVECSDHTLYTGWSLDVAGRVAAHNAGRGAKYTRSRRPVSLVWSEGFATKAEAMRWEWRIKQWPRKKKEALYSGGTCLSVEGVEDKWARGNKK